MNNMIEELRLQYVALIHARNAAFLKWEKITKRAGNKEPALSEAYDAVIAANQVRDAAYKLYDDALQADMNNRFGNK